MPGPGDRQWELEQERRNAQLYGYFGVLSGGPQRMAKEITAPPPHVAALQRLKEETLRLQDVAQSDKELAANRKVTAMQDVANRQSDIAEYLKEYARTRPQVSMGQAVIEPPPQVQMGRAVIERTPAPPPQDYGGLRIPYNSAGTTVIEDSGRKYKEVDTDDYPNLNELLRWQAELEYFMKQAAKRRSGV